MPYRSSKIPAALIALALLGLAPMAQAQMTPRMTPAPLPLFPDPSLQPGYEKSPQTTQLNQRMLEQIERNPGAPMASAPFTVQPGATVTYPPRVQAPYPQLTPQRPR